MTCLFPENAPNGGYRKGCRCDRCCAGKAAVDRQRCRPSPCRRCGTTEKPKGGWYCDVCAPLVVVDRIASAVTIDTATGCWIVGDLSGTSYKRASRHRGAKPTGAHRVMYEHFVGEIPDGLELDHLCSRKPCVNPDHLEPVTRSENVRRARARKRASAEANAA